MNSEYAPPPPPTSHMTAPGDHDASITYWVYSVEKGMEGPFTKKKARATVKDNPGVEFLACREGEDWQDAATRLARKKKPLISAEMASAFILIVALLAGWWWWQKQQKGAPTKPPATIPAKSMSAGAK